jgi:hypothetical protein
MMPHKRKEKIKKGEEIRAKEDHVDIVQLNLPKPWGW